MYATQTIPQPPAPGNPDEARRVEHTRNRFAMMEGRWLPLLEARLEAQLGTVRRAAWGVPDISNNPMRTVCYELATLYDAEPDLRHNQVGPSPNMDRLIGSSGSIARSGLWAQMARFQALIIALREMWLRVDIEDGRFVYRPVPPHMTFAEADPARPTLPLALGELRLRQIEGKTLWAFDIWDIRDPENPSYRVVEALDGWQFGRDFTATVHGATYQGADYPAAWRRSNGAPVIPAQLYHASTFGDRLFDPFAGVELYEGSLNLAVLYSYLNHCIRDASYPQRYAIGVRVAGLDASDLGSRAARSEVTTDPTTILMLDPISETSQPMVGQYQAGADVEKLEATIAAVAHRLATDAGLAPSELQRTSGSARSGYAISLSQEGKRSAQRRYVLQMRAADEALIGLSAILYNRWSEANSQPTNYPEGGYSVLYREIPLSPDEMRARREHVLAMLEAGLMDRVEAIRFFGSLSEQDAVAKLAEIQAMQEGARPPTPAEGVTPPAAATPAKSVTDDEVSEDEEGNNEPTATEGENATAESIAAAATAAGQPASAVALNGAQVQAAQGIIVSVSRGELPRETGVQMLIQFFNIPADQADQLMGPVGRSFVPAAPT